MNKFHVTILTIFPEMFPGPLGCSLAGNALDKNIWSYDIVNIRDFGLTKHQNVDDTQYGGSPGLVMRADVIGNAIDYALNKNPEAEIIYPSPRGKQLTQAYSKDISRKKNIIILCGRFEGIDERVFNEYNVVQVSIGNYILSGGEIAAFVMLDSVIRLLPGVLVNQDTLLQESFDMRDENLNMLVEHPLYTKPSNWRGRMVPEILISGHHQKISKWRLQESIRLTKQYKPELLNNPNSD